jgi:diguanylate cyclase (GGDEF)-like protein
MKDMLIREIDGEFACEIELIDDNNNNESVICINQMSENYYTYPIISNDQNFYGCLHFSHQEKEIKTELESFLLENANILAEACEKVKSIREQRRDSKTGAIKKEHLQNNVVPDIAHTDGSFCYILFDIDDFSEVNNEYSHAAGDHVLMKLVEEIEQSTPETKETYVGRLGGEEFAVVIRDISRDKSEETARDIAESISERDFMYDGNKMNVTVSGGVVHYPTDAEIPEEVFEKADNACYKSKVLGKNRVTYSKNVIDLESASRYHLTKDFKQKLGDIHDSYELHEFNRNITVNEHGEVSLQETRKLTQREPEADGFPVIIMSEGSVSNWSATKANIDYVIQDGDNSWILALEIPDYVQNDGDEYDISFECSLGQAYQDDLEDHVTDLTLYDPPVQINDTFDFSEYKSPEDAWIEEYDTEDQEFIDVKSETVNKRKVKIENETVQVELEVVETPTILRTIWEW